MCKESESSVNQQVADSDASGSSYFGSTEHLEILKLEVRKLDLELARIRLEIQSNELKEESIITTKNNLRKEFLRWFQS